MLKPANYAFSALLMLSSSLVFGQTAPPSPPLQSISTVGKVARSSSKQKMDIGYGAKIKEFTTGPEFTTELVDHLPASDKVPTPEKVNGYIAGAAGKLTNTAGVNNYMRELAKATNRVKVMSLGMSEEGREMIVVAISDEGNLKKLKQAAEITNKLADPRKTTDAEAEKLIKSGKAIYWFTGAMHSTETGSPEMLMELAYRLAVEDSPFIKAIRKNVIVMMTPILETDGRDRVLDVINNRAKYPGLNSIYWGHYVQHDNNRDGMSLALALTRNVMKGFLEYHPTVLHDLHESVPFLYTSTGSGPYNAWIDPIVINEWHQLAYEEINEMSKRNVPGVWTHGFYDGWAPNYMFYIANGHNSIGRFYETFGNSSPETQTRSVGPQSGRDWFRPNPPLGNVKWSLRNNVNYQQSAALLALHYTADHKGELLHNFYLKSKRSVEKARVEGPAAYILPGDEKHKPQQAELIKILRLQGVEVHQSDAAIDIADGKFPAGSYVIRMDQPYSRMADMLLDLQYYNVNDPAPYDDTGWSLGPLKNVRTVRAQDVKLLSLPMKQLTGETELPPIYSGKMPRIAILHTWQNTQNEGWWRLGFEQWKVPYEYIDPHKIRDTADLRSKWDVIIVPPGVFSGASLINGVSGAQPIPWMKTSETPALGVPDSSEDIRGGIGTDGAAKLKRFVEGGGVVIGGQGSSSALIDLGLAPGVTTTRPTGFQGQGTVFNAVVTDPNSPVTAGLEESVAVYFSNGPFFQIAGENDPKVAEDATLLGGGRRGVGGFAGRPSGRGSVRDADVIQARINPIRKPNTDTKSRLSANFDPKLISLPKWAMELKTTATGPKALLRFADADDLLVSGMLAGGEVLAGRAAVVDIPIGKGHTILFSINPMWRAETQGSYTMVFNACLNLPN